MLMRYTYITDWQVLYDKHNYCCIRTSQDIYLITILTNSWASSTKHRPNMSMVTMIKYKKMTIKRLTHWGLVAHICVIKLTIIGSNNIVPPGRRQTIIWTNAGILLMLILGTNCSEIFIEINTFHWRKCISNGRLENVAICPDLNVTDFPDHFIVVSVWDLNHQILFYCCLAHNGSVCLLSVIRFFQITSRINLLPPTSTQLIRL